MISIMIDGCHIQFIKLNKLKVSLRISIYLFKNCESLCLTIYNFIYFHFIFSISIVLIVDFITFFKLSQHFHHPFLLIIEEVRSLELCFLIIINHIKIKRKNKISLINYSYNLRHSQKWFSLDSHESTDKNLRDFWIS